MRRLLLLMYVVGRDSLTHRHLALHGLQELASVLEESLTLALALGLLLIRALAHQRHGLALVPELPATFRRNPTRLRPIERRRNGEVCVDGVVKVLHCGKITTSIKHEPSR